MASLIPEEDSNITTTHTDADQSGIHQPEIRPKASHEANILHSAFFGRPLPNPYSATNNNTNDNASSSSSKKKSSRPQNERLCMGGHRETIFGLSLSSDGKYMASASQDSSICIWDVNSHRLVAKLTEGIDEKFECLRVAWMNTRQYDRTTNSYDGTTRENVVKYVLASSGADGIVRLWSGTTTTAEGDKLKWQSAGKLDHSSLEKNGADVVGTSKEDESPQVYALQFVRSEAAAPNMDILLTSANDCIYLWNIVADGSPQSPADASKCQMSFLPYLSVRFTHLDDGSDTNQFGGERNPNNELYVFDASYCESNDLMGVALSDGTCRVVSLANSGNESFVQEQCVLSLPPGYFPGRMGHLTALSWDKSGTRLATCIASGRVILWLLQVVDRGGAQGLHPSCISVLQGGHDAGRPLFGAKYCGGENEELLMTWGVDGKVCVWDSYSVGEVLNPLCTLVSHSNYPIYALDATDCGPSSKAQASDKQKIRIALGGGSDGGFLGVPAYIYDV
mmetsp:Transcript_11025/g.23915  ORF Transcript_11025/g.23915 Transcript_11025/m.23915 type:complete len:508 (+) Transcript_11025:152-1675(+)